MGETRREALSGNLAKSVKFHFQGFRQADLGGFTVEKQKSDYAKAKSELVIFDGAGKAVIKGREFGGGQFSLWST